MVSRAGPALRLGRACLPMGRMIHEAIGLVLSLPRRLAGSGRSRTRSWTGPPVRARRPRARTVRRAHRRRIRAAVFCPTNLSGDRTSKDGPACVPAKYIGAARGEGAEDDEEQQSSNEKAHLWMIPVSGPRTASVPSLRSAGLSLHISGPRPRPTARGSPWTVDRICV